jgi:pimeloyl-ACP methyl ester carboxylesterase
MNCSALHVNGFSALRPEGDPVVLIHGLGSCAEDWGLQVPALIKRHDVYALDLPGHGASLPLQGWPRIGDYAAEVADWMADEKLKGAHLVGLSLGGLVAMQLGLDQPPLVRSLTIVNAFSRMRFELRSGLHSAGRLLLLLFGRMEWLGAWVASALFPEDGQGALREQAARRIAANPRRSYLQAVAAVARFNLDRRVHELDCPVLIVSGEQDRIVPMRLKRALAESIPEARFETIPTSGHVTPVDSSDRFNRLLLDFFYAKSGRWVTVRLAPRR